MTSVSSDFLKTAAKEYVATLPPDQRNQFFVECGGDQRKPSKLLSMPVFAGRYGCTTRTVSRWCKDGILKPIRRGRLVRIPEDQLYSMQAAGGAQ